MSIVDDKACAERSRSIPDGWVETTLGEICDITSAKRIFAKEYQNSGIPFFRGKEVTEKFKGNDISTELFITEKKYFEIKEKYGVPKENDILLTSVGTLGNPYLVEKYFKFYFKDGNLTWFRDLKNINSRFLYYWIISSEGKEGLSHAKIGSTQQAYTMTELKRVHIILPPIQEQKAIAKVLTAFDDKIENLRAQNKTLEQTAQTIFKEWFGKYQVGDVLPDGWRVGTIGDLTEIKRGGSPRPIKDYISDSGYRWLKISDATATTSPYIFEIKEHIKIEGLKKTTLKNAGDLVLSNSATPGMPKFLAVDTCVHDGWMHFPSSIVSNEYLYLLFLHIRPTLVQQGSGSVFVNLKTDILRFYETVIPSSEALENFDKLIKPVFDKILSNAKQIQTLTKTRDSLLPKLMRGEIRINGFKT